MSGDPFKRRKVDPTQALAYKPLPSAAAAATAGDAPAQRANVIAQLVSRDGTPAGPQLDVPADVTPKQLEELLNGLLGQNDSPTPYTFYAADAELLSDLGSHLQGAGASVEGVLQITYQPQALFRVAPVSRCSSSLAGHAEAVLSVAFSPNGKHLATGSGDMTVRFYDLDHELPAQQCKGHSNWVLCVSWAPDGAVVASGAMDGEVRIWQPSTGNVSVALLKGHRKGITALAWEPAHLMLPSRHVASSSRDNTVRVWDITTRRCLVTLTNHTNVVSALVWSGDGLLYTGGRDAMIYCWSPLDGTLVRSLKGHGHWVNSLALSTEFALRTGGFDHYGKGGATGADSSPEEAMAAAKTRWEAAKGGQPERLVSGSDDYTLFLWHPGVSKQPVARLTGHQQLVNCVRFSPDGSRIASASFDKCLKLWDGFTGAFLRNLRAHVGPVYQLAWSADSRMLVSASKDSTLKLWCPRTGALTADLPGHEDEVYAVDWAPAGGRVASAGKDTKTRLWRQ